MQAAAAAQQTCKHPPLPYRNWEAFHATHSSAQFFKERRYVPLAFPELMREDPPMHIVELGCGCGSSIVPVLKVRHRPLCTRLRLWLCACVNCYFTAHACSQGLQEVQLHFSR